MPSCGSASMRPITSSASAARLLRITLVPTNPRRAVLHAGTARRARCVQRALLDPGDEDEHGCGQIEPCESAQLPRTDEGQRNTHQEPDERRGDRAMRGGHGVSARRW